MHCWIYAGMTNAVAILLFLLIAATRCGAQPFHATCPHCHKANISAPVFESVCDVKELNTGTCVYSLLVFKCQFCGETFTAKHGQIRPRIDVMQVPAATNASIQIPSPLPLTPMVALRMHMRITNHSAPVMMPHRSAMKSQTNGF